MQSRGDQYVSRIEQPTSSSARVSRSAPFTESIKSSHVRPVMKKRTSEHLREIIDRLMPSATIDAAQAQASGGARSLDCFRDAEIDWQSSGDGLETCPSACTNDGNDWDSLEFVSPSDVTKRSNHLLPSSGRPFLFQREDERAPSSAAVVIEPTDNDVGSRTAVATTTCSIWRQNSSVSTYHSSIKANLEHDGPAVICATIPVLAPAPLRFHKSWNPNVSDPIKFGMSTSPPSVKSVALPCDPPPAGRQISYDSRSSQLEDEL